MLIWHPHLTAPENPASGNGFEWMFLDEGLRGPALRTRFESDWINATKPGPCRCRSCLANIVPLLKLVLQRALHVVRSVAALA